MNIKEIFLKTSKYTRSGFRLIDSKPRAIVIHYFANPNTTAEQNYKYFSLLPEINKKNKTETYASYHYLIDDTEVIHAIPDYEVAFHAGAKVYKLKAFEEIGCSEPNHTTISIGCAHPTKDGKFTEKTIKNLIFLTTWLMLTHEILPCYIYRHFDFTNKMCPLYYVDNNKWQELLAKIKENYYHIKGVVR